MKDDKILFEELLRNNTRESAFSQKTQNKLIDMDENLLKETSELYESVVKPTVRKGFEKLMSDSENDQKI